MLKNFTTTIKRYSTSVILNMIGLSVAYAAFIILLIQVTFEYGYESYNKDAERVYRVTYMEDGEKEACWPQPAVDFIGSLSPKIEAFTIYTDYPWNRDKYASVIRPNGGEEIFSVNISATYQDLIDILNIEIIEGDKNALKTPYSFMIPQSAAKQMWGDESAVGKMFTIGQNTRQVGAVYKDLPDNSVFENFFYYSTPNEEKTQMGQWNYFLLVKLDNPNSEKEITPLINKELDKFYIEKGEYKKGEQTPTVALEPISDIYYSTPLRNDVPRKGNKATTATMLAIAILILTIAAINYVNFASALTPFRIKMLNLQKIMGGNKWSLRRALLFESAVISMGAFAISLLIIIILQSTNLSEHLITPISLSHNLPLLFACAAIALCTGIFAGMYPAFYMTSIPPALALKGTFGMSPKGMKFRAALIGFQFTISLALIIATIFVNLQNRYIGDFSLGFKTDRIIVTKIAGKASSFSKTIANKLKQSAEIEDVAFASDRFGGTEFYEHWGASVANIPAEFNLINVSPNFLTVMDIEIAQGRDFREEDVLLNHSSAIFNHITPKSDGTPVKIGEGLVSEQPYFNFEIIGFVSDNLHTLSMRVPEAPFGFFVGGENQGGRSINLPYMYIKVKPGINMLNALTTVQKAFKEIVPAFPAQPEFMDNAIASLYVKERNTNYLVTLFSFLTIIISLVGVFGLVLFETQFRRREIGIRRVHGATVASILEMYNKKYLTIVGICFIIAAPISYYAIKNWLSGFAYRIPLYWWVFALGLIIVLMLTALTVTLRCWRAASENPANSIR